MFSENMNYWQTFFIILPPILEIQLKYFSDCKI
jgi:hypothetical protein